MDEDGTDYEIETNEPYHLVLVSVPSNYSQTLFWSILKPVYPTKYTNKPLHLAIIWKKIT